MGRGHFPCPKAAWLWLCLMRLWACSPLIQASAAPAVASSVAISAQAVLPLLSPPASVAPPAAATWWWAPPTPAAGAVTGARRLRPLPARIARTVCPAGTAQSRNAPRAAAPRIAQTRPPAAHTPHVLPGCPLRVPPPGAPSPREAGAAPWSPSVAFPSSPFVFLRIHPFFCLLFLCWIHCPA